MRPLLGFRGLRSARRRIRSRLGEFRPNHKTQNKDFSPPPHPSWILDTVLQPTRCLGTVLNCRDFLRQWFSRRMPWHPGVPQDPFKGAPGLPRNVSAVRCENHVSRDKARDFNQESGVLKTFLLVVAFTSYLQQENCWGGVSVGKNLREK